MKRFFQISGMALLIMLFTDLRNPAAAQPGGDVSYQDFYDELSPYGRWIDYPEYGYVWSPNEGADFRPYSTNGQWVWSDEYEWMWVSDYNWGWAPFHYGRWFFDDQYGWMWVPGYDWSPAWVAWRGGGEYYGWAPLQPGITISVGFSMGSYAPPVNYWCFAPSRYITSPRIYDYCLSSRQNVTIINHTTIINNYNYHRNVFITGPRRHDVERITRQRISPVRVRDIGNPGRGGYRNNEVAVYRPGIQRSSGRSSAPRQFDHYGRRADNSVARRSENRIAERDRFNDRTGRNNDARVENRNEVRNRDNRDNRVNRPNEFNNERVTRPGNTIREQPARERPAREVFGRDNRRGFDQPVRRNNIELRNREVNNDNRTRNENRFRNENGNRPDNNNFNRRMENNNRIQEHAPARQERSERFNNRNDNRPQQQRQALPQMNQRQQGQPRRFESPNHGRRG